MLEKSPHPYDIRDTFDQEIQDCVQQYPDHEKWGTPFSAVYRMTNNAGHPNDEKARHLLEEDVIKAIDVRTPAAVIRFALQKALEWRKVLIKEKGRSEWSRMQPIELRILKARLTGKISGGTLREIFG